MNVTLPAIDPNVLVAVAAAAGAILTKVIEKWLGRRSDNVLEAERIRTELRNELNRFRDDNVRLNQEIVQWRQKYWDREEIEASEDSIANKKLIANLEAEVSGGIERIRVLANEIIEERKHIIELETTLKDIRDELSQLRSS